MLAIKFEERRLELITEEKEKYIDMVEFYAMKNVFYLPEISRWSYLMENAKQDDIALKIDTALLTIEKNNGSKEKFIEFHKHYSDYQKQRDYLF